MPQFDITTFFSQVFWLLVSFLAVFLFFRFFYIPKMRTVFEKREVHIHSIQLEVAKLVDESRSLNEKFDAQVDALMHQQKHELDLLRKQLARDLSQIELDTQTNLALKISQLKQDLHEQNSKTLSLLPAILAPSITDFCEKNLNIKNLDSLKILKSLNEEIKNDS
jgi:F-type H+-transporting ATPase subunit b